MIEYLRGGVLSGQCLGRRHMGSSPDCPRLFIAKQLILYGCCCRHLVGVFASPAIRRRRLGCNRKQEARKANNEEPEQSAQFIVQSTCVVSAYHHHSDAFTASHLPFRSAYRHGILSSARQLALFFFSLGVSGKRDGNSGVPFFEQNGLNASCKTVEPI